MTVPEHISTANSSPRWGASRRLLDAPWASGSHSIRRSFSASVNQQPAWTREPLETPQHRDPVTDINGRYLAWDLWKCAQSIPDWAKWPDCRRMKTFRPRFRPTGSRSRDSEGSTASKRTLRPVGSARHRKPRRFDWKQPISDGIALEIVWKWNRCDGCEWPSGFQEKIWLGLG